MQGLVEAIDHLMEYVDAIAGKPALDLEKTKRILGDLSAIIYAGIQGTPFSIPHAEPPEPGMRIFGCTRIPFMWVQRENGDPTIMVYPSSGWRQAMHELRLAVVVTAQKESSIESAADDPNADRANISRLFSGEIPRNMDIVDLAVRLDAAKGSGRSQRTIATEFTNGDAQKAQSLLSQIRRLRRRGRLNL